jgi:hypothetical protein
MLAGTQKSADLVVVKVVGSADVHNINRGIGNEFCERFVCASNPEQLTGLPAAYRRTAQNPRDGDCKAA